MPVMSLPLRVSRTGHTSLSGTVAMHRCLTGLLPVVLASTLAAQGRARIAPARLDSLKSEVVRAVETEARLTQQIVDMLFSFGELAFQEVETSRYLTDLL